MVRGAVDFERLWWSCAVGHRAKTRAKKVERNESKTAQVEKITETQY
jgi:hypothetical protein